jgi:hypothetical protein
VFHHTSKLGMRGYRLEAAGIALSIWQIAGLAEVQESGSTGGEARGRGRLGTMSSSGGRFSFRACSVSKASVVQVRAMSARTTPIRGFGACATIL